jgi:hypothetical protein
MTKGMQTQDAGDSSGKHAALWSAAAATPLWLCRAKTKAVSLPPHSIIAALLAYLLARSAVSSRQSAASQSE